MSCETVSDVNVGSGFEIYLTLTPYSCELDKDYSTWNLDTVALFDAPILRNNDIVSYDTVTHKLTLNITNDSLKLSKSGVYGRMFVVTIDRKPIYCGFKWPAFSSVHCNWVFIPETLENSDQLTDKQVVISFNSAKSADPRLDKRIVNKLKLTKKLK